MAKVFLLPCFSYDYSSICYQISLNLIGNLICKQSMTLVSLVDIRLSLGDLGIFVDLYDLVIREGS